MLTAIRNFQGRHFGIFPANDARKVLRGEEISS